MLSAEMSVVGVENTALPLATNAPVAMFISTRSAKNFWPALAVPGSPSISTSLIRMTLSASIRSIVNCLATQPGICA